MRRFVTDSAALSGSNLIAAMLQLALQLSVVRILSVAEYGAYVAALVYSGTLEMILTARSGELAMQMVGKHLVIGQTGHAVAAARRLEREDLFLFSLSWLGFVPLSLLLSITLNLQLVVLLGLALVLPVQTGYAVSKSLLVASGQIRSQATLEVAYWAAHFLFGLAGVVTYGILGLVAGQVLATAIKTLVAKRLTSSLLPRTRLVSAGDLVAGAEVESERWSAFGAHSMLRNSFNLVAGQVDLILLTIFQAKEIVAVYKVAKSLASLPARLTAPVWSAVRPRLLQAWHEGDRLRVRRVVRMPALAMFLALAVCAPLAIALGRPLLIQLYGPAYATATVPFLLLTAGSLLYQSMTGWFGFWVVIAEVRQLGTSLYLGYLVLLIVAGLAVGANSPVAMAAAVAIASTAMSAIAWILFERGVSTLRPRPAPRTEFVAPAVEA